MGTERYAEPIERPPLGMYKCGTKLAFEGDHSAVRSKRAPRVPSIDLVNRPGGSFESTREGLVGVCVLRREAAVPGGVWASVVVRGGADIAK